MSGMSRRSGGTLPLAVVAFAAMLAVSCGSYDGSVGLGVGGQSGGAQGGAGGAASAVRAGQAERTEEESGQGASTRPLAPTVEAARREGVQGAARGAKQPLDPDEQPRSMPDGTDCSGNPALCTAGTVAAGGYHTVALKSDGTVWAWGNNDDGQLGDNTTIARHTPVQASGLGGVVAVAAGATHTVALKSDGMVWAWGYNGYGQLGDNTVADRHTPVEVSGVGGNVAVTAGTWHTVALQSYNGTLAAWGYNGFGQLGDNTTTNRYTPVLVFGIIDVVAVAAGGLHTVALKSNGTVWAWGYNGQGQLGDNSTGTRLLPVQVSGLSGVIAVAAGGAHTVALKSDGTVRAWGNNDSGQLGDNTIADRHTPVQVSGLSGVIAVAAGGAHTVALKSDGTVWAWGFNYYGQLGDNTTIDRRTPLQVGGLGGVIAVAAGDSHTVALKSDGTVWAWGLNLNGQLGDNTVTDRHTPVQSGGTGFNLRLDICHGMSSCVSGACTTPATVCTALDQCHDVGTCDPGTGTCSNPAKADGTSCDDGAYCNGTDHCIGGVCSVHAGDPCTGPNGDGDCSESCNEAANDCSAPDPDGSACDDGSYCNGVDTCVNGTCQHAGSPCPSPDGDANCAESCNEATSDCSAPDPDGSACDDGNPSTTGDVCTGGVCAGVDHCAGVVCTALDQCHDAGSCIDHATGACSNPTKADSTPCDDGIYCNGADACQTGACTAHVGDPCPGPNGDGNCTESCSEAAQDCTAPDPDGSACDDGIACTGADQCQGGQCSLHAQACEDGGPGGAGGSSVGGSGGAGGEAGGSAGGHGGSAGSAGQAAAPSPSTNAADQGGCGCRVGPRTPSSIGAGLVILTGLTGVLARRRRRSVG
jgi:MYXO-CTERM domain-containing protein